jgi:hypothetical protein
VSSPAAAPPAGQPTDVEYSTSFIDGSGSRPDTRQHVATGLANTGKY